VSKRIVYTNSLLLLYKPVSQVGNKAPWASVIVGNNTRQALYHVGKLHILFKWTAKTNFNKSLKCTSIVLCLYFFFTLLVKLRVLWSRQNSVDSCLEYYTKMYRKIQIYLLNLNSKPYVIKYMWKYFLCMLLIDRFIY